MNENRETSAESKLLIQHAHADREVRALSLAVEHRDSQAVRAAFNALEMELLKHFADEERVLFPRYAPAAPEDVATLVAEHARFRDLLHTAHGLVEQGLFDKASLRELTILLNLHHAHEETGVYRWARANAGTDLAPSWAG
jgi:hypothetical protein